MNKKENSMLTGVIWKQILIFFFPIVIGTFFQQLYNTVDAVIVGRFAGKEALSSVGGSSALIINLIVGFFVGLTNGCTVLISQFFGAGDKKKIEDTLHTSYALAVVGGILLMVIGILVSPWILTIMNTPAEIFDSSLLYIRVYFSGVIFVFIYNMGSSILRAMGDSRRPLYYLIICTIINIILDVVLVLFFGLGVLGVAIATLIAQAVSAILVTITIMKMSDFEFRLRRIRFVKGTLGMMMKIGLPTGVQSTMYSFSNMIIQTSLNVLGVNAVAAWAAYGKIDVLFWMINSSFGIALATFVGQNFGAGNYDRMRKGVRSVILMDLVCAIVFETLIVIFNRPVFMLFTTDAKVLEYGARQVLMLAPFEVIFVVIEILSASLRAQGDTLVPTLISLVGIVGFRIVWVLIISVGKSMEFMLACYPLSWAICAVLVVIYYFYKQTRKISWREKC